MLLDAVIVICVLVAGVVYGMVCRAIVDREH